jgi:predicted NAD/FAD-dependent oxidoreductase
VTVSPYGQGVRVIVVGAGIAGVACAVQLAAAGADVRVLERDPAPGGRMGGLRIAGRPVDMGAAYFTVRDSGFAEVVGRWQAAGLVRPWTSELGVFAGGARGRSPGPVRYAAPPGLGALVADLAGGLEVEPGHEVRRVGPGPVVDGERADAVVLAMPDPQAQRLLDPASPAAAQVAAREWQPAIAVAAGWEERRWPVLSAAFVNDHPVLTIVADDGDRRGDGAPVLVAHTTAEVAAAHPDRPEDVVEPVLGALRDLLGVTARPAWTAVRSWPAASPARSRDRPFFLGDDGVALAGDGWGSPRVETAWRSGTLLGRALTSRSA